MNTASKGRHGCQPSNSVFVLAMPRTMSESKHCPPWSISGACKGLIRCSESGNEIQSTESLIADVLQKMILSPTPGTNRLFQTEKQMFTLAIIREYQITDEVHKASLFSDV